MVRLRDRIIEINERLDVINQLFLDNNEPEILISLLDEIETLKEEISDVK